MWRVNLNKYLNLHPNLSKKIWLSQQRKSGDIKMNWKMKWKMKKIINNVEFCWNRSIFRRRTDLKIKLYCKISKNNERKRPWGTLLNSFYYKTLKTKMSLTTKLFTHQMRRMKPTYLMMMTTKMNNMNTSCGKLESSKELGEIEKSVEKSR